VEKLKILDLFSGVGGISAGLERTQGFETLAFCEIDPFCRLILSKHWPAAIIHEDVTTLDGEVYRGLADMIVGGFPSSTVPGYISRREGVRN